MLHALDGGLGAGDGGEGGHAVEQRGGADVARVGDRVAALLDRVDDHGDLAVLDHVDDVGAAFGDLVDHGAGHAGGIDRRSGTARGDQLEAQCGQAARDLDRARLVTRLTDRKTLRTSSVGRGKLGAGASWLLTKASPKVLPAPMTSPVDFISGPGWCRRPGT